MFQQICGAILLLQSNFIALYNARTTAVGGLYK